MLVIETQYFPPIQFFSFLAQSEALCIEKHENYNKQTYRNRCYILGANKIERLTVPVLSTEKGEKQLITEVKLDNRQNWQQIHWRSIQSAYGNSPFFAYYEDMLAKSLFQPVETLFELNENILQTLLKILNNSKKIYYTETYHKNYTLPFVDKRNQTAQVNAISYKPYTQVFGNQFVSNLSILDLIFCQGKYLSLDV
jgi:hypothetical protein